MKKRVISFLLLFVIITQSSAFSKKKVRYKSINATLILNKDSSFSYSKKFLDTLSPSCPVGEGSNGKTISHYSTFYTEGTYSLSGDSIYLNTALKNNLWEIKEIMHSENDKPSTSVWVPFTDCYLTVKLVIANDTLTSNEYHDVFDNPDSLAVTDAYFIWIWHEKYVIASSNTFALENKKSITT